MTTYYAEPGRRNPVRRVSTSLKRLDLASLAVLPAGVAIVLVAQLLEGGAARSLVQGPAALIVFGGTFAALLISYSPRDVWRAIRAAARTFLRADDDAKTLTSRLVGYAVRTQRKGVLMLEEELDAIDDPFLRTGIALVVDGAPMAQLKDILAAARSASEADEDAPARVFEAAAGYAPTLGILGAVLGLIQVMEHLSQPGALGSGIAVAFVATVYGVGAANLVFLPIAGRLRERAAAADRRRELVSEGVYALHQRMHPRLVAERLRAFADDMSRMQDIAGRVSSATRATRVSA
ncbi:MAG: flagellar motor protein [Vicinamibacterales bacterium]